MDVMPKKSLMYEYTGCANYLEKGSINGKCIVTNTSLLWPINVLVKNYFFILITKSILFLAFLNFLASKTRNKQH